MSRMSNQDYQADRAKRFASAFANNLSYEDLRQWATYMKSEDAHLRSMGEQKILIVWNAFFPTDKSLPSQLWDILKLGVDLYKQLELKAIDERTVDFINICYDIEKFREQWKNTIQPNSSQLLTSFYSPQPLPSTHSSARPPQLSSQPSSSHSSAHPPQLSSQPSSSHSSAHPPQLSSQPSSSVRPSRRVKPISMGKRLQDLILPKTALQTNCPEEELKFFEKIAENKMANFSLDLWVKNVFSAIPRQQHYAHVYLILAWNEEYPTRIDQNGYIHLLNGMKSYVEKVQKPYNIKVKTLIKILRKLEKKKNGIFEINQNDDDIQHMDVDIEVK